MPLGYTYNNYCKLDAEERLIKLGNAGRDIMLLSECESCRDYYNATIDSIAEYASDRDKMERYVQLDMVLHLWAVRDSAAVFQNLEIAEYYPMLQELLKTLGRKEEVGIREQIAELDAADDENEVEVFRQYRLPDAFRPLVFTGDFWLNLISKLEAAADMTALLTFVEKAVNYSLWQSAYCAVFAWQYSIRKFGQPGISADSVVFQQYWQYQQQEKALQCYKYVAERVKYLEESHANQQSANKYLYREDLFLELIQKGMGIQTASRIGYLISTGRGGSQEVHDALSELRDNDQDSMMLENIKYLAPKSRLIKQLLFTEELL